MGFYQSRTRLSSSVLIYLNKKGGYPLQVTVKLFAELREGRFEVENSEVADQSRVTDVVQSLNIPSEQVRICLVNGKDATIDHVVQNGDTVSLFPAVGGA